MSKNYTKQRGYLQIPTEEGKKWLHFSMNFIVNLQELTGKDLITWSKELEEKDTLGQGLMICDLIHSGMLAFDQEEDNDINYNVYKVRNWGIEAMNNDADLSKNIMDCLSNSLGKQKGAKK